MRCGLTAIWCCLAVLMACAEGTFALVHAPSPAPRAAALSVTSRPVNAQLMEAAISSRLPFCTAEQRQQHSHRLPIALMMFHAPCVPVPERAILIADVTPFPAFHHTRLMFCRAPPTPPVPLSV